MRGQGSNDAIVKMAIISDKAAHQGLGTIKREGGIVQVYTTTAGFCYQ